MDVVEELLTFPISYLTPEKCDGVAHIVRAIKTKNLKVVNLVCFNCEPDARDEFDNSLLHLAAQTGSVDIVHRIYSQGFDIFGLELIWLGISYKN